MSLLFCTIVGAPVRALFFALQLGLWLLGAGLCRAQLNDLPDPLGQAALGEQAPSALAPADFSTEDFELVAVGGSDPTVRAFLEPGSLRWVRTEKLVLVPRAMAVVQTRQTQGGSVLHAGFTHPLVSDPEGGRAEVPVALLSAEAAVLEVRAQRHAQPISASFAIRFRPRAQQAGRVLFDSSCSPYGLHVSKGKVPPDSFLYVGCRLIRSGRAEQHSATLELHVLWNGAGSAVEAAGAHVVARASGLFTLRVGAKPGRLTLSARGQTVELGYFLPDPLHLAFMGAGLGAALYDFEGAGESTRSVVPLLTLYAGYSFDPTTRIVYFSAVAGHRRGYVGQGLYLWFEQLKAFDDRLSMNLLLGANLLIYRRGQRAVTRINAPQGVEFILRDFAGVNRNLTLGAFLYPDIYGSAYYDGWIRWGSPRFFAELNFLYWREPYASGATQSQTLGLSFGMPILRFL